MSSCRATNAKALGLEVNLRCATPENAITRLWNAHGEIGRFELCARLGLCAAAEHLLAFAKDRSTGESAYQQGIADGAVFEAHALLGLAGIDPERWEAAR